MLSKRLILRICLIIEVIVVLVWFVVGIHGLVAMLKLIDEQVILKNDVIQAQNEVDGLRNTIVQWKISDFYKEKIAREQLHMARPDEQVFVLE